MKISRRSSLLTPYYSAYYFLLNFLISSLKYLEKILGISIIRRFKSKFDFPDAIFCSISRRNDTDNLEKQSCHFAFLFSPQLSTCYVEISNSIGEPVQPE